MIDFSFIRFKDNLADALNVGNSPIASVVYYDAIHLSPNESYLQITNVEGGISLQNDFTALLVDCNGNTLEDVTDHIYTEEITGVDGNTQLKVEIVNIGTDYYNRPILLKFFDDFVEYYSNPFILTDEFLELSTYFQYKNYNDFRGISYSNADVYQSIRLNSYFLISRDISEISDYYQISREATISARVLYKSFEDYKFDYIDRFVYDRLNVVLQHEIIYVDGVRITNKTNFESGDLIDKTNLFETTFSVTKNYADSLSYSFQVFDSFNIIDFSPSGLNTLCDLDVSLVVTFNHDVQLETGFITIYDASDDSVVKQFTEADMIASTNTISIPNLDTYITETGNYYVLMSSGLVTFIGIPNEAIIDPNEWTIIIGLGEYEESEYNNDEYNVGCVVVANVFNDKFNDKFN